MVGREDSTKPNDDVSKRIFWRSASWSASRSQNPSDQQQQHSNIPSGSNRTAPLTPRSNSKARACLPPLQPLSISRRSLDEWPKAGSDDVGEWPNHPPTPTTGLKLDLSSSTTKIPDKTSGLAKREKIAYFDKECSKVAEHIYVGGDAVAKDITILKKNKITHILNCVGFICPEYFKSDFIYRSLWLQDSPSEDITSILYDVFDYFEDVREQKGRIFVHCCQGVSRSTSLVIAYLMWREGQSFDDAFNYVKSARSIADPNMGFACQLLQCQKRVHAFPLSPTSLLRMYKMSPHSPYDPLHLVPKLLNEATPASLDSRGAFIVQLPSAIYIWVGKECVGIMETDAKAAVCQIVRYEKAEAAVIVVREGEETSSFWEAFSSFVATVGSEETVRVKPGERKVEAYDVDFEVFFKAIEGGFVPALTSHQSETHVPARENTWSSLKCKFASRFRSVSKTPLLSRVYSDSMMIVHASGSPTTTTSSLSTLRPSTSIPPSLALLPNFSGLSLGVSDRKVSTSIAERRGSLKKSLKLPGLQLDDESNDIVFDLDGVRNSEFKRSIPIACRWPGMEIITELSRDCLDSESVIAAMLPSDGIGESGSRNLYIWIGKSFDCSLLDSETVEKHDWVTIGESILSKMDLPKDTPIKIVKEAEEQTEFLALLSAI